MSEAAPPHALLRPRIAIPFLIVSLIWGSTWWVILGQIDAVPPSWSVALRFMIATPAMFAVGLVMRKSLRLGAAAHGLALFIGATQFCGNLNMVYRAELTLTSGIVAVMFGLLIVPNALLGRAFLGQKLTRNFLLGSLVAVTGIALLLWHEAREASAAGELGGAIALGIFWGIAAMLSASIANIAQAGKTGKSVPMVSLLAWSMLYGTFFDIALAWLVEGAPIIPTDMLFWAGLAYLAIAGSVVTFPLYYTLVRELGAGRAAYHAVLVVIVAMVLSTAFEAYRWNGLSVTGGVLSLAGMLLALRARNPSR